MTNKTYKISVKSFLSIKSRLDQLVFWRFVNSNTIEVKPICKYARLIIESNI